MTQHYWSGSGGLESHHFGLRVRPPRLLVFVIPTPISRNIAGVTYRYEVVVGWSSQLVDDLECSGLLALNSIGINRVDYGDFAGLAKLSNNF